MSLLPPAQIITAAFAEHLLSAWPCAESRACIGPPSCTAGEVGDEVALPPTGRVPVGSRNTRPLSVAFPLCKAAFLTGRCEETMQGGTMAQKVVPYCALVTLVVQNGVTEARGCPLPGGRALSPRSRRQGPASALSTLCSGAVRIPRAPPPGPPRCVSLPTGLWPHCPARPPLLHCLPPRCSLLRSPGRLLYR